jgi:acyl-coenzyme A thioesterase PaaI-like protein
VAGRRAFQEAMGETYCFGCGVANPEGLQLKSYWDGEESVATFRAAPAHAAGPRHVVNGGIIATVIDCHAVCTAIAAAYRAEGREIGSEPSIWYVTASLQVSYLKPAAIDRPLELRARVTGVKGKKSSVACSLSSGGVECARGEVLAIRVGEGWRKPGGSGGC